MVGTKKKKKGKNTETQEKISDATSASIPPHVKQANANAELANEVNSVPANDEQPVQNGTEHSATNSVNSDTSHVNGTDYDKDNNNRKNDDDEKGNDNRKKDEETIDGNEVVAGFEVSEMTPVDETNDQSCELQENNTSSSGDVMVDEQSTQKATDPVETVDELRHDSVGSYSDGGSQSDRSAESIVVPSELVVEACQLRVDSVAMKEKALSLSEHVTKFETESRALNEGSSALQTEVLGVKDVALKLRESSSQMKSELNKILTELRKMKTEALRMRDESMAVNNEAKKLNAQSAELNEFSQQMRTGVTELSEQTDKLQISSKQLIEESQAMKSETSQLLEESNKLKEQSVSLGEVSQKIKQQTQDLNTESDKMSAELGAMMEESSKIKTVSTELFSQTQQMVSEAGGMSETSTSLIQSKLTQLDDMMTGQGTALQLSEELTLAQTMPPLEEGRDTIEASNGVEAPVAEVVVADESVNDEASAVDATTAVAAGDGWDDGAGGWDDAEDMAVVADTSEDAEEFFEAAADVDADAGAFRSSKLGTKAYWDDFYNVEIKNFSANEDDTGEIWFGGQCMMKTVQWILDRSSEISAQSSVLDIGCGNGVFLAELAEERFESLYGIDYSENAVELATQIAKKNGHNIAFKRADFLDMASTSLGIAAFDICHDKGTYDAISLREDAIQARELYQENLMSIMHENSLFVITSCNWTLEELKSHFQSRFNFMDSIDAPTFTFGGKVGAKTATAIFRKR